MLWQHELNVTVMLPVYYLNVKRDQIPEIVMEF